MTRPPAAGDGPAPPPVPAYSSCTFTTLGTYAYVAVRDAGELAKAEALAREILTDVDETCSRFREDSDLSAVNENPGQWTRAHPVLVAGVRVALDAARLTDGLVTPLLGRPLSYWGYDRDFASLTELADRPLGGASEAPADPHAWTRVELDQDAVRIPAGTALDLGATAKAWASDMIAAAWRENLDGGALISLGGDLAIVADGQPWPIAVSERPHADPDQLVTLDSGGLATSSTTVRRWRRGGAVRHHLIDPRTGRPANGPWRTITATGASAVAANTATTAALILGTEAVPWLDSHAIDARLVDNAGRVRTTGTWPVPDDSQLAEQPTVDPEPATETTPLTFTTTGAHR